MKKSVFILSAVILFVIPKTVSQAATVTITNWWDFASGNIAINVPEQPLGGIVVTVTGEDAIASRVAFSVSITSGGGHLADITDVELFDCLRNMVVSRGTNFGNEIVFNGPISFPSVTTWWPGGRGYFVRGKLGPAFENPQHITLQTTPQIEWVAVGQISGQTIAFQDDQVTLNTMIAWAPNVVSVVNSALVPSGNVNIGAPNQILGAFDVTVLSEPILITAENFVIGLEHVFSNPPAVSEMAIYDKDNHLVAGPIDPPYLLADFTNNIVLPVGTNTYVVVGKLSDSWPDGQQFNLVAAGFSRGTGVNTGRDYQFSSSFISTITAHRVPGDVNGDGFLTTLDMAIIRAYILGLRTLTQTQLLEADFNGDGLVTTLDIAMMRRVILGIAP